MLRVNVSIHTGKDPRVFFVPYLSLLHTSTLIFLLKKDKRWWMNRTVKRNKSRKKEKKEEEIGLDNSYRKRGKNHNNGTSFRPTYVHVFVIGAMALTGFFLYNFLLKRGTGGNEKREYILLSVFFSLFSATNNSLSSWWFSRSHYEWIRILGRSRMFESGF